MQDYTDLALSIDYYASNIDSGPSSISQFGEPITSNDLFLNDFSSNDIQFADVASQLDYLQVESVFDTLYEQESARAYEQAIMENRILDRQEQEFGEFLSNVSFGAYHAADFIPVVGTGKSIYENGGVLFDSNASLKNKAYASGNIVFDLFGGKVVKKVGGVLVAGVGRISGPVKKLLGYSDEAAEAALRNAPASIPKQSRFVDGVSVVDRRTGQVLNGTTDLKPTLDRIKSGGSFPHRNDGSVFRNRESLLPNKPNGYYQEFVHPTPGVNGPGPQRVILGKGGEAYYTPDHYGTFVPINP